MRKMMLAAMLAATAALPTMASAQDAQRMDRRHEMREDRRDLRHDRRELQRDRRDYQRNRVAYVSPYRGWRYQPVTMGYQLRPAFYGQRYWVNDYGRYNVAAPRPNLRWVRYGNDLLLVNVRSGRVFEVRHNVAW